VQMSISIALFLWIFFQRNKVPPHAKKNLLFTLLMLGFLIFDLTLFILHPVLALAFNGESFAPAFVEIITMTPYIIGGITIYPIFWSWMRLTSIVDGPFAATVRNISWTKTRWFRIVAIIYIIFFTVTSISLSVLSTISDDLYFPMVQAQAAINALQYFINAISTSVLGITVIKVLRLKSLIGEANKSTFYYSSASNTSTNLKLMKLQVNLLLNGTMGFLPAATVCFYLAAQYPVFDTDKTSVIAVYSFIRGLVAAQVTLLQLGFFVYIILIKRMKVQHGSFDSKTTGSGTLSSKRETEGFKTTGSGTKSDIQIVDMNTATDHLSTTSFDRVVTKTPSNDSISKSSSTESVPALVDMNRSDSPPATLSNSRPESPLPVSNEN